MRNLKQNRLGEPGPLPGGSGPTAIARRGGSLEAGADGV